MSDDTQHNFSEISEEPGKPFKADWPEKVTWDNVRPLPRGH